MNNAILSRLPGWADKIEYHECIGSTNVRAKELAKSGAPKGTVVIANSQTAGRGRLGRSFHSPAGDGLYLSLILRPQCPPAQLMHLTCAVAVAACDAVQATTGVRPGVKWINDLVLGRKKLGGILAELSVDPKTGLVDYAIIGIGINCGQTAFPEELQPIATSLAMAGYPVDRAKLAAELIRSLDRLGQELSDKTAIMARYRENCVTLGQRITVIQGESRQPGTAVGLDDEGALLVDFGNGPPKAVNSGEVSVRGLFGYL